MAAVVALLFFQSPPLHSSTIPIFSRHNSTLIEPSEDLPSPWLTRDFASPTAVLQKVSGVFESKDSF